MNKFKAMKSVYGYYFPEVRKAIDELFQNYPHDIFHQWCNPGLDDFHVPIINTYLEFQERSVPNLKNFEFSYPTAGSEEGIREILTWLQSKKVKEIYVLEGEYEGYKSVAETRCIKTIEVKSTTDPSTLKKGYWFISNPSARDGNIIPNKYVQSICEAGHQVFYDLTYLGLTNFHEFDLSHPNIFAAVASFSKPFGLFSYRIGFTFSKEEIPSLYGNKWFKSIPALLVANEVMMEINSEDIAKKYKPVQKKIIDQINKEFELGMYTSDALLLGHLKEDDAKQLNEVKQKLIEPFKRKNTYRFCLTPYYQELEKTIN